MNKKIFSTAAVALSLAAGSAFAAADGPDYNIAAAQGSAVSRAEVNAQAVQAQQEARSLFAAPDGGVATAAATPGASRSRAEVKAETIDAIRVSGLELVNTPY